MKPYIVKFGNIREINEDIEIANFVFNAGGKDYLSEYEIVRLIVCKLLSGYQSKFGENVDMSDYQSQQAEIERLKEYEDAVYAHFDVACHSYDASKSVYDNLSMLQSWHCDIALDPKVSKPANDLHSEIDRLKGQRDRLTDRLKESQSAVKLCLDKFMYTENARMADKYHQIWTINSGIIAEIEAEK